MKKYILVYFTLAAAMLSTNSCESVDNKVPAGLNAQMDTTLYPGLWSNYLANEWPDFATVLDENPDRNAIIEDFTGHQCTGCPAAATVAHDLHTDNPDRVFVASIHAGPTTSGITTFQQVSLPNYTVDFTNPNGLELGGLFGVTIAGSGFGGNPSGSVNRSLLGIEYFYATSNWFPQMEEVLAGPRLVQIKAELNYFPSTEGFFLHTEIVKEDASINYEDLGIVIYLIEDSLEAPQLVSGTYTPDYIHRDIMRGTISGRALGRSMTEGDIFDDKYYHDYSFKVPNQLAPVGQTGAYNAGNMHLLINVYDRNTYEILQVIKKKIE